MGRSSRSVRLSTTLLSVYMAGLLPRLLPSLFHHPFSPDSASLSFSGAQDEFLFLARLLKHHTPLRHRSLLDLTAVDHPSRALRFELVYLFGSVVGVGRVLVRTHLPSVTPSVVSLSSVYSSAPWLEREVFDLFGIFFRFHPDLRRILTDYGFVGFPLRKDFPLAGYLEVRYDDERKRIVQEPLEVSQEFRLFDFSSPWEEPYGRR